MNKMYSSNAKGFVYKRRQNRNCAVVLGWRVSALVCEQHRGTLCVWMSSQSVWLSLSLPLCWTKWRGNGHRNSCASRGKHIGQLRQRLCVALLCVGLIESERQTLTALRLRTLQVITHKSLFPCIGSSAQLRPHKQSTSASFITSGCLLTFSDTQSNRQFRYIRLSRGCCTCTSVSIEKWAWDAQSP